ncbi:MAG: hypothetical protein A2007_04360 [Verrucomicrobia bacterium GWC2_42_7]|nr:MAG: hypothetical protein A2007_04360 [Verrucomicrobia bacterium GWC2_42_7]
MLPKKRKRMTALMTNFLSIIWKISNFSRFSKKQAIDNQRIKKFNQTDQIDQTDQTKVCVSML